MRGITSTINISKIYLQQYCMAIYRILRVLLIFRKYLWLEYD